jgi:hypothetical protein
MWPEAHLDLHLIFYKNFYGGPLDREQVFCDKLAQIISANWAYLG